MREGIKQLLAFMKAREAHRVHRETGKWPKGFKPDPIISQYRFCNVRRNDDRVTKWLHKNWLAKFRSKKDGWFAFAVARCAINRIDTMEAITAYVVPWQPEKVRAVLKKRREAGMTIYGAAYMIGTQGNAGDKIDFLIDKVLTPLWESRLQYPHVAATKLLSEVHEWLDDHYAIGSFTAGQVIADWKYADPTAWDDFYGFATSGPGSRRGLNRVLGLPHTQSWTEHGWRESFHSIWLVVNGKFSITAQDLQNCLCEFDKYERARLGQGRPKQLYVPNHGED